MKNRARQLRRLASTPSLTGRGLNRLAHRRFGLWQYNEWGTAIFEEDWDNLVILDACRFDMFRDRADFDGRLESRISRGSSTVEFLHGNLVGRTVYDTVYVTGNPQLARALPEYESSFYAVEHIWNGPNWDDNLGTVLPKAMADAAIKADAEYPDKRLLVHFVQPHYPFVDSTTTHDKGHFSCEATDEINVWNNIKEGSIDQQERDAVIKAYYENLDTALPAVARLLDRLAGTTVVTADHGNMLGERARPIPIREWGHPRGIYTDELVYVPWFVSEGMTRKQWFAEDKDINTASDLKTAEDRLRDLGYL